MLGFSELPAITGVVLLVAGMILLLVFIRFERARPYPVLNIRLFSESRLFAWSNIAALINYSATYAVAFLLSLDLQFTKGFSPEYAGLILVAAPFSQALVSPFAGRLSDRIDPGVIASIGMAFTALGLFLLVFLGESTSLYFIIIALIILGIGFGLFSSPNTNAIMSAVDKRYYGVSSGIIGTMRLLGQMLSMGIAMMIFAILIGHVEITPDLYPCLWKACIMHLFSSRSFASSGYMPHSSVGNLIACSGPETGMLHDRIRNIMTTPWFPVRGR